MQNSSEDIPVRYRWGLGASVILHLLLIAVLLFGVPDVFPPEEEQSIHVELVEPEEKAPEPAPSPEQVSEPETSQVEEPAAEQIQEQKPQAFESAAPEDDKPQPEEPVETTPTEEPQTQTETAEDKVAESKEEAVTLQPVKSDPELKKSERNSFKGYAFRPACQTGDRQITDERPDGSGLQH
jgi:type IV secretory pathway VirB10-like protein